MDELPGIVVTVVGLLIALIGVLDARNASGKMPNREAVDEVVRLRPWTLPRHLDEWTAAMYRRPMVNRKLIEQYRRGVLIATAGFVFTAAGAGLFLLGV